MDCHVRRCDGRGTCQAKVAVENAICLVPSNVCSPWGLCTGDAQHRTCQLQRTCAPDHECPTDGIDCSGRSACGLVSTCAGGACVDQTCDVGRPFEPCGFHCGSQIVGGTCQVTQ
jgi:hypothetical protein